MPEFQEKTTVVAIERLDTAIYRITVNAPLIAGAAHPGQFVMVRLGDQLDPLLRRPFSVHQVSGSGTLQLLFKVVGRGTRLLARLEKGQILDCIGPLGRGFALRRKGRICIVGGGMGLAPLYFLAKRLLLLGRDPDGDVILMGGRTRSEIALLADDFFDLGYPLQVATDDGSMGYRGMVVELLDKVLPGIDQVYCCGPWPMMAAAVNRCRQAGVICQVSLETHMACGLGACLGCVVPAAGGGYAHVCKDGPVFTAGEIEWHINRPDPDGSRDE